MTMAQGSADRRRISYRFGDFELRLDSGELLRSGAAVKLQPRPARVLEILAGQPGAVVPREEIRRTVWGDETYVDFDLALNFCIFQIRRALGDSAARPRFVATIPRRGYRFLAPVEVVEREAPPRMAGPTAEPRVRRRPVFAGALALLAITLGLVVRPGPLQPPETATRGQASSAQQLYLEGQFLEAVGDADQARERFQEAALLDPKASPVFAALAQVLLGTGRPAREILTSAEAAERRALELDSRNFVAYVDRGQRLFQYEHDWQGAEGAFRRAVQLGGRSAAGHYGLAMLLAAQGRHGEAIEEANRALALEPERRLGIDPAWFYYLARRDDEAIEQARRTIELASIATHRTFFPKPALRRIYWTLILAELAKGDARAALAAARDEARAMAIRPPATLAGFWEREKRHAGGAYLSSPWTAVVAAMELGEHDRALDLLDWQCNERSAFVIPFLRVDPLYDPLRGLPRFAALLRRAKLPAPAPLAPCHS